MYGRWTKGSAQQQRVVCVCDGSVVNGWQHPLLPAAGRKSGITPSLLVLLDGTLCFGLDLLDNTCMTRIRIF